MATMKKAVLYAPEDLRIEEVTVPSLQPGDFLIKVTASLVCGTDVRIYTGAKTKNVTLPSTLGHEFSGNIVEANGPLPGDLTLGDQVTVCPVVPCGTCSACRGNHPNICRCRTAFGYQYDGGLAQYVRIPAAARGNVFAVNGVSPAEAAIIEPAACALNAQNLAEVTQASTVLVVGTGPLGLLHIRLAKAQGVSTVIAVEPNVARHAQARESGADLVIVPGNEATNAIEAMAPDGIDVLIAAVGLPEAIYPYLGQLAPGARISAFAGFKREARLDFLANDIHYNEWKVVGASSCRVENFAEIAPMVASGRLHVADLIGTQLPLDQSEEALALAASGTDMRVGIDPWA